MSSSSCSSRLSRSECICYSIPVHALLNLKKVFRNFRQPSFGVGVPSTTTTTSLSLSPTMLASVLRVEKCATQLYLSSDGCDDVVFHHAPFAPTAITPLHSTLRISCDSKKNTHVVKCHHCCKVASLFNMLGCRAVVRLRRGRLFGRRRQSRRQVC